MVLVVDHTSYLYEYMVWISPSLTGQTRCHFLLYKHPAKICRPSSLRSLLGLRATTLRNVCPISDSTSVSVCSDCGLLLSGMCVRYSDSTYVAVCWDCGPSVCVWGVWLTPSWQQPVLTCVRSVADPILATVCFDSIENRSARRVCSVRCIGTDSLRFGCPCPPPLQNLPYILGQRWISFAKDVNFYLQ